MSDQENDIKNPYIKIDEIIIDENHVKTCGTKIIDGRRRKCKVRETINGVLYKYAVEIDKTDKSIIFYTKEYYTKDVASVDPSQICIYLTNSEYKRCKNLSMIKLVEYKPDKFVGQGKTLSWTYNKFCHRDNDLPAVIEKGYIPLEADPKTYQYSNTKEWYRYGHYSRWNGPAIVSLIHKNISIKWYINGECHRDSNPASIKRKFSMTRVKYYENDRLIRREESDIDVKALFDKYIQ